MNIRDRLMSRASVAAMAAFAKEPQSTVPAFAERIDDEPGGGDGGGGHDPLGGLTAEEQAQFDAMNGGPAAGDTGNADPAGDEPPVPAGDEGDDNDEPDAGDDDTNPDPVDPDPDAVAREPEPPAAPDARKPKTISYGRHQKLLSRAEKERAELQTALAKEREERVRLDARAQMLLEAINTKPKAPEAAPPAAPKEPEDPEPDGDVDPLGHAQWSNRQLTKRLDALEGGRRQEQQLSEAEREEREVYGTFEADLHREAQVDPGFADAFSYLRDTRYRELGFIYADIDINDPAQCATLTPSQQKKLSDSIQQAFYNEQIMVARGAMQAGKSPAKVVANLARARGYAPKAAVDPTGAPPAKPNGNGAAPSAPRAPAAPPAAQPSVTDQLEQIRQNQAASRSLSDAGGSPGGEMTLEQLVAMPQEEFEAILEGKKGRVDRMMGKAPM
jgi:hypothetical protein